MDDYTSAEFLSCHVNGCNGVRESGPPAMAKTYRLVSETLVPAPIEEVFDFFSRAENLERITPPELGFRILTPLPIEMRPGALIAYRLKLNGIPFRWQTEITVWEPTVRFVDVQLRGPYRQWVHEHRFESVPEGTRMTDDLTYALPLGFFGNLAHRLFVRKKVEAIFSHREKVLSKIFPGGA